MKKSETMNLDDVLSSAENTTDKSKSKAIEYPNKVPKVAEFVEVDRQISELEARQAILKDEIYSLVSPHYFTEIAKKYESSMIISAADGASMLVTWQKRFQKLSTKMKDTLQDIVKDAYNELFNTKVKIEVKEDISEEALVELVNKVGKDRFAEFFKVSRQIVPTEAYVLQRKKMLSKEQQEKVEEVVKQVVSFRVVQE
jgi:REP element-mobilizing transposase RayT